MAAGDHYPGPSADQVSADMGILLTFMFPSGTCFVCADLDSMPFRIFCLRDTLRGNNSGASLSPAEGFPAPVANHSLFQIKDSNGRPH